jgi:hypothetical protein
MWTLIPSVVWQDISAPGTSDSPGRKADIASSQPLIES